MTPTDPTPPGDVREVIAGALLCNWDWSQQSEPDSDMAYWREKADEFMADLTAAGFRITPAEAGTVTIPLDVANKLSWFLRNSRAYCEVEGELNDAIEAAAPEREKTDE